MDGLEWINICLTAKRSKYFCDFSRLLTSTENIGEFSFTRNGCKMTEERPKILGQIRSNHKGFLAQDDEENAVSLG